MFRYVVLALAFLVCFVSQATAVPVTCVSASGLPCLATSGDVLAGGVIVPNSGNDAEATVEAAIESATGSAVDLLLYGKSDQANAATVFKFEDFDTGTSLTASTSGKWTVLDGTLISYISIKAANSFAVYAINPASSMGTYDADGIFNKNGVQQTVSHISFWTTPGDAEVPEPATMLLLGAGLIGGAGIRRRKNHS